MTKLIHLRLAGVFPTKIVTRYRSYKTIFVLEGHGFIGKAGAATAHVTNFAVASARLSGVVLVVHVLLKRSVLVTNVANINFSDCHVERTTCDGN